MVSGRRLDQAALAAARARIQKEWEAQGSRGGVMFAHQMMIKGRDPTKIHHPVVPAIDSWGAAQTISWDGGEDIAALGGKATPKSRAIVPQVGDVHWVYYDNAEGRDDASHDPLNNDRWMMIGYSPRIFVGDEDHPAGGEVGRRGQYDGWIGLEGRADYERMRTKGWSHEHAYWNPDDGRYQIEEWFPRGYDARGNAPLTDAEKKKKLGVYGEQYLHLKRQGLTQKQLWAVHDGTSFRTNQHRLSAQRQMLQVIKGKYRTRRAGAARSAARRRAGPGVTRQFNRRQYVLQPISYSTKAQARTAAQVIRAGAYYNARVVPTAGGWRVYAGQRQTTRDLNRPILQLILRRRS